jgi:L-lactate dehydrogenase complex protein LldG
VTAREEILARIGRALTDTVLTDTVLADTAAGDEVPRRYRTQAALDPSQLLDLFAERLHDYGSTVRRIGPGQVLTAVAEALSHRGARRVVVPPGLDLPGLAGPGGQADRSPADVDFVADDGLSPAELDAVDGVITAAAVAIAETGTIVLDGSPGQGRRVLSLVPDYHLCILRADQVVGLVPEALARLTPGRPLTWISGPSATSDIELDRVQGVHGPRTLEVILIEPGP